MSINVRINNSEEKPIFLSEINEQYSQLNWRKYMEGIYGIKMELGKDAFNIASGMKHETFEIEEICSSKEVF